MTTSRSDQLPLDAEKQQKPVRVLDAAEADATECITCGGKASFRVTHGTSAKDYCDRCVDSAVAAFPDGPVPYGELPEGF